MSLRLQKPYVSVYGDEHEFVLAPFSPRGLVLGNSSWVVLSGTLLTAQK